jgi:hypothetical protein
MLTRRLLCVCVLLALSSSVLAAEAPFTVADPLYHLTAGKTKQVNALWTENPANMKFGEGRTKVVIANLTGPGIITMIHFALPQRYVMTRDVVLRIWWDGEKTPSVEAPLCDFFCDPNGALERVDSALVNKKRGWNCYFPMPFAKSARVEVAMESKRYPGADWSSAPCYSYVHYRTLKSVPADSGYFHACWRQQTLFLGKQDYNVFEAKGRGQWIGWNMTIHAPGSNDGYPVDENENFYIDGEREASISWQGLEDSFGFSWGFPEVANSFPFTGYQPYYNGAAAYRFNNQDRISFAKSIRMTVDFGKNENAVFRTLYSKPGSELELSSVAYWYQKEPHVAFVPLLSASNRAPNLLAAPRKGPADPNETLSLACGRTASDVEYLANGWDFELRRGYLFTGWPTEVPHCWADFKSLEFAIICPKGVEGTLKLYIIDGDNFMGGRKQSITVAGKLVGEYENFQSGRWIEVPISAADTASGRILVVAKNLKPKANAVVSFVRFVKK